MKEYFYPHSAELAVSQIELIKVKRKRGYVARHAEGRRKHTFLYTAEGEMSYLFDSGKSVINAKKGELVFVPRGTVHSSTYLCDNTEVKVIQFNLLFGVLPAFLGRPEKLELIDADSLVEGFFASDNPFHSLSRMYDLLYRIERELCDTPARFKKLKPALAELAERFFEERKTQYYADLCGMSEVGFRRLFKEYTGKSPIDYRNELRLKEAAARLSSGDYNVTEAAESVGFRNLSFFIKLFKQKYGKTPKQM